MLAHIVARLRSWLCSGQTIAQTKPTRTSLCLGTGASPQPWQRPRPKLRHRGVLASLEGLLHHWTT